MNDGTALMTKLARGYDRVYNMKLECFNLVKGLLRLLSAGSAEIAEQPDFPLK